MSRLTMKGFDYRDLYIRMAMADSEYIKRGLEFSWANKLQKLEDIEEEIGIDLITLFKALKQMFVFDEENIKIELLSLHIKSNKLYLYGFVEDTSQVVYLSFEDYKKTWWLSKTKEK